MKTLDYRSDTITKPTDEMRKAAFNAKVGDDVFADDPTVNELERYAAEITGKEAALFVSSGTQGNLVSVMSHTKPGDEVILEADSHIYMYEVGGMAAIAGCMPHLFHTDDGYLPAHELEKHIRPPNIHYPIPRLLCLENTHNRHGGVALSPAQIAEMASVAHKHGLKVHLDGARIFNAAIFHGVDVKEYTKHVDSMQFCLSKGLSAPIGSIVVGDKNFIDLARKKRKMLGGGMRQVGIIAAPGLVALKTMINRLQEDHDNAKQLAIGMRKLGFEVKEPNTNIVLINTDKYFVSANKAVEEFAKIGILTIAFTSSVIRMTTHRHISSNDIKETLSRVENLVKSMN